ncbi:hypothetical protein SDC9_185814 [bioreactor metagenome]|uniref:Uncharacterized protein n=1 Tax=bioreactor metagenome TaxID=1076179 RepID=A0A645HHT1_9ZZZZ
MHAGQPAIVEQCEELRLQGFLAPIPAFAGAYLRITETGHQQLNPEFPQSPFVWGPGAQK